MNKVELIKKLNTLYGKIEELADTQISEFKRELNQITDEFGETIQDLEDNGIESNDNELDEEAKQNQG